MENSPTPKQWELLLKKLESEFGKKFTIEPILLLIGMQEMNMFEKGIKKEIKVDLMHIAMCKLLENDGYYTLIGYDEDKWPIYELIKPLPDLTLGSQVLFLQEKILNYFRQIDFIP